MTKSSFYILLLSLVLHSCSKEKSLPLTYDGYALLTTYPMNDGVRNFEFYLLSEDEGKKILSKHQTLDNLNLDYCIVATITDNGSHMELKRKLRKLGFHKSNKVILTRLSYNIFGNDWLNHTKEWEEEKPLGNRKYHLKMYMIPTNGYNDESILRIKEVKYLQAIN